MFEQHRYILLHKWEGNMGKRFGVLAWLEGGQYIFPRAEYFLSKISQNDIWELESRDW